MSQLLEAHRLLSEAEAVALQIVDSSEQERVRRGILSAGGILYTDVMMDIIRMYPDLDPDSRS